MKGKILLALLLAGILMNSAAAGTYNEQTDCKPTLKEVVSVLKDYEYAKTDPYVTQADIDYMNVQETGIINDWASPVKACCMSSFDVNNNYFIDLQEFLSALGQAQSGSISEGCFVRVAFQLKTGVWMNR